MPGIHLLVDVKLCASTDGFVDPTYVSALFQRLLEVGGLIALEDVYCYTFPADVERGFEEGLTLLQCLTTSHMSYHSVTEEGGFHFDLFTCKTDIDVDAIIRELKNWVDDPHCVFEHIVVAR